MNIIGFIAQNEKGILIFFLLWNLIDFNFGNNYFVWFNINFKINCIILIYAWSKLITITIDTMRTIQRQTINFI